MTITLSDKEATLLCRMIEAEQNDHEYEHYWMKEEREMFDKILYKLKCGFAVNPLRR